MILTRRRILGAAVFIPLEGLAQTCGVVTPRQTEGPFFTPNSPLRTSLVESGSKAPRFLVSGRVLSPDCKPVEGVVAALHDLSTGRALWTVRATVRRPTPSITPAVSDDGSYALIALPYTGPHSQIALISMDDGRIVQTFRSPGPGFLNIGFLQGGRGAWVHSDGMTALYDLRARAQ